MRRAACLLLLFPLACAMRPPLLEPAPYHVVVKSVRLPERSWLPWYTRFAEHAWVEIKLRDRIERLEWTKGAGAVVHTPLDAVDFTAAERWQRGVAVVAETTGPAAQAIGERMLAVAAEFPHAADYRAWPGANSNTFVVWLAREAGLGVHLPPNAVGKDYAGWLAAGVSSTGLGLHVDTALLGVQAGLVEGVELHALGLTAGVGLWPPSLKLPFLPAIPGGWFAPGTAPDAPVMAAR